MQAWEIGEQKGLGSLRLTERADPRRRPGPGPAVVRVRAVCLNHRDMLVVGGARVAITSPSDEKLARAREFGAEVTVNYRTTPEWGAQMFSERVAQASRSSARWKDRLGGGIANFSTIIGKRLTLRGSPKTVAPCSSI